MNKLESILLTIANITRHMEKDLVILKVVNFGLRVIRNSFNILTDCTIKNRQTTELSLIDE